MSAAIQTAFLGELFASKIYHQERSELQWGKKKKGDQLLEKLGFALHCFIVQYFTKVKIINISLSSMGTHTKTPRINETRNPKKRR